ncbi:MAG: SIMPL domain-containing protein, partial [Halieaceae bacterium]
LMWRDTGAPPGPPPNLARCVLPPARGRALAIAYEKAKRDALSLATAAGLTLGPPDTISTGSQRPPIFRVAQRAAPAAMDAEMAPRYEPGKLSVSASVSVIFLSSP